MAFDRPDGWPAVFLTLVVCAVVVSGVGGAVRAGGTANVPPATNGVAQANNTTVYHENPETVDREGDLGDTRTWLERRFAERLGESSIRLSQGQYERARELVGNDTRDLLGKYVDVAGETEGEGDDEATEELREAREQQRDFVESVREYRETYQEYEEAKQNGNERRARRLAHELERTSRNASRTGDRLVRGYENVSRVSGTSLAEPADIVQNTTRNISRLQAEIRESEFVRTNLDTRVRTADASFLDPLTVDGRLTLANGSAVANRTVRFRILQRTVRATTDGDGRFTVRYRPVTTPLNTSTVTLYYLPADTSPYLGANDTFAVSLVQVEPTVTVATTPTDVQFGDAVTVSGTVTADGVGAEGVPLVVSLGGQRLGRIRTDDGGQFAASTEVPLQVEDGAREVRVRIPLSERALAPASGTATLAVFASDAALTVNATQVGADTRKIRVRGRLTTVDGTPLARQPVTVRIDGNPVGSATTDETGRYSTVLTVPEAVLANQRGRVSKPVTVVYDGSATNVRTARAGTRVQLFFELAADPPWAAWLESLSARLPQGVEPWMVGGGVVGLLGLGAGGVLALRRRSSRPGDAPASAADDASTADDAERTTDVGDALLAAARDRLRENDPGAAIRASYAAARQHLATAVGDGASRTHWEFYRACRDALDEGDRDALRALTERYEQVAFAAREGTTEAAEDALDAAHDLTD